MNPNATIAALRVELAEARAEITELKRENEQLRSEIRKLIETKKRATPVSTQVYNWCPRDLHDRD